jgi:hypothetical protein
VITVAETLAHWPEGTMTDLFIDEAEPQQTDPLIGLVVDLEDPCRRCRTHLVIIGAGKGPHAAALACKACGEFRGWVSRESYRFISETIKHFGRTTTPISVRRAA